MNNSVKNPLEAMRFGTDYKFKVKLRGCEIIMRPLSQLECLQIIDETQEALMRLKDHQRTELRQSAIFAHKTLELASTSKPGEKDFQITDLILCQCTPDEVMFLFNEYNKMTDKINPSLEKMPAEELNKLIDDAKKNILQMTELSFWQIENLCRALIQQLLQADSLSGGPVMQ